MTVTNGSCRILCQTSSSVPSLHSSFQEMELHDISRNGQFKTLYLRENVLRMT